MPLDGVTLACLVSEFDKIMNGRIDKIAQTENDELILSIRGRGENHKLLLTANASHPRVHFTAQAKNSPLQAPMFCMLLRKHLNGGKITAIRQPDFERIVVFHIESLNEMGDMSEKRLIIEIMGKHSNIILVNDAGVILDAIKHVSHETSSVREVLPGRPYLRPPSGQKISPLKPERAYFFQLLATKQGQKLQHVLYQSYNGVSPIMASEICDRAGVAADSVAEALSEADREKLFDAFAGVFDRLGDVPPFGCQIYRDAKGRLHDFSALPLGVYEMAAEPFESPSAMLEVFYRQRDNDYRMDQKTADLRKLVTGHMDRCAKKKEVFRQTLADIADRDRLRVYGEMLTAYIYGIDKGATTATVPDFNDGSMVQIPLDPMLTPAENAQAYFKQYNKAKRTFAALQQQMQQNEDDLRYLDSVLTSLQTVADHGNQTAVSAIEDELAEIRGELAEQGFVKKQNKKAAAKQKKSKPLHYRSSDGFDIYVGKNNAQNDELTLRFAQNGDIWLHTKEIPGSHVIIQTNGDAPPERTLQEAANLAAYHSKARLSSHVPVDYALKKHVRKPNGAKPGYVIYDTNKTAYINPEEPCLQLL